MRIVLNILGWSLFPVAYLPGQSTFEMQITSGKFEADLFSMTNGTDFVKKDGSDDSHPKYKMVKTEHKTPDANHKIALEEAPVANTVYIRGLTRVAATATLAEGQFQPDGDDATGKTLKFYASDTLGELEIHYEYEEEAFEALIDNKTSAVGEATLVYPVYGGAASECSVDSSIIGYVILKVFRARVTAQPGLDGSYKQAGTYQFTLATLDAKRDDQAVYSIAYIKDPDLF